MTYTIEKLKNDGSLIDRGIMPQRFMDMEGKIPAHFARRWNKSEDELEICYGATQEEADRRLFEFYGKTPMDHSFSMIYLIDTLFASAAQSIKEEDEMINELVSLLENHAGFKIKDYLKVNELKAGFLEKANRILKAKKLE